MSSAIRLETDSVDAGPKGRLSIDILDEGGKLLATVESTEVGIGGKLEALHGPRSDYGWTHLGLRRTSRCAPRS